MRPPAPALPSVIEQYPAAAAADIQASGDVLIGGDGADTAKLMLVVVDAAPAAATVVGAVHALHAVDDADQIHRGPKMRRACHEGLGRKFCTTATCTRADFAIARFYKAAVRAGPHLCVSGRVAVAASRMRGSAVSMRLSAPCNIFTISAISVLALACPLAAPGPCRCRRLCSRTAPKTAAALPAFSASLFKKEYGCTAQGLLTAQQTVDVNPQVHQLSARC